MKIFKFLFACAFCFCLSGLAAGTNDATGQNIRVEISKKFAAMASEKSTSKSENLAIDSGMQFTRWPSQFLELAIAKNLSDAQIGRLITALPESFIDEPCRRKEELVRRKKLLDKSGAKKARIKTIGSFIQISIDLETKHCR